MGFLSDLFGGGDDEDVSGAANYYLDQIPGIAKENLNPYINRGMEAGNAANDQYSRLLKDPTGFIDSILASYEPSKGYEFREKRLRDIAKNAAAAGGYAGTPEDILGQTDTVNGVLGQDMQQFLQNILGAYNTGLQGKQGFSNEGYNASSQLTDYLANNLSNQGGIAAQGAIARNQSDDNFINALLGAGSSLAGGYMAGGGKFGLGGGTSGRGASFLGGRGTNLGAPSSLAGTGRFAGPFQARGGSIPGMGFR